MIRPLVLAVGVLLVGSTASAEEVPARTLRKDPRPYQDRTVELDDIYDHAIAQFTHGERELGYTPDSHAKLKLRESGLWALVPRTDATAPVLKALKPGARVWLRAVVRVERINVPDVHKVGTNVDLTIMFPDERLALLDVRELSVAPLQPAASTPVDAVLTSPDDLIKDPEPRAARVEVVLKDGWRFSRAWTDADQAAGSDRKRTVRVTGVHPGLVLHVPRLLPLMDAMFNSEPGDRLVLVGRTGPGGSAGARVFVVEKLEIAAPR